MNKLDAKRIIVTLIFAVLAVDAVALAIQGARVVQFFRQSECGLVQTITDIRRAKAVPASAQEIRLERTEGRLDLWSTPQGQIWTAHGETLLGFLLFEQLRDIYEPPGHEVRPGDVVLDCGANIGVFTRKALTRGARQVVAIEPSPSILPALRRNFEPEIRAGRVIVYPKGVWDRDAELQLTQDDAYPESSSVVLQPDERVHRIGIPVTTIDQIVAELNLPRVDFIKMDIEGAEKPALQGAQNTLRRFRPRMSISTEHLPDDFTAIPALVRSIEPRYTSTGCDCLVQPPRIKALVMAFDPLP